MVAVETIAVDVAKCVGWGWGGLSSHVCLLFVVFVGGYGICGLVCSVFASCVSAIGFCVENAHAWV